MTHATTASALSTIQKLPRRGASPFFRHKKTPVNSGVFWCLPSDSNPRKEREARRNSVSFAEGAIASTAGKQCRLGCAEGAAKIAAQGFESLILDKKNTREFGCFLAPVEGLEPPTLRLTAACSTG